MNKKYEVLVSIYRQAFCQCMETVNTVPTSRNGGPANPLLVSPPEDYFGSGLRIMYFGQETNGYEGSYEGSRGIDHLLGVYKRFTTENNGFPRYGGQFWNAIKHFQGRFHVRDASTRYVWNNLIKIGKDHSKGRPSTKIMEWQFPWIDVVKKEVDILDPHVVIFFSGPNYDSLLKRTFEDATFEPVLGFELRKLAKVKSKYLPDNSFRTYHPGYLYRHGFYDVPGAIEKLVCGE